MGGTEPFNRCELGTHHPTGGTVDKIFSITCATCQARLAVRSEAAIGAILECPRCHSMVQVLPPPGWKPSRPPAETPPTAPNVVPQPPENVAAERSVELEPVEETLLDRWLRPGWLLLAGAAGITAAAALGLWLLMWLFMAPSGPEPAGVKTDRPSAAAVEKSSTKDAKVDRDASKPMPVAVKPDDASTVVAAEPANRPADSAAQKSEDQKPDAAPASSPSSLTTQSPDVVDAKPPEPDPFAAIAPIAEEAAPADIKKAPAAVVDVAARLDDPVAGLELTDVPFGKAVELLAAMGSLPVTIDVDALVQPGVAPRDPISLRLEATTIGKALDAVAAQKGLALRVEGDQVLIASPAEEPQKLKKVRYTVSDLTGDDKAAAAELAVMVERLVSPDAWQPAGGRGTIEPGDGVLIVEQNAAVHRQVLVFCEKLRIARQKPLRSREDPAHFTLATRSDQAKKLLDRPVTAVFHEPTPLARVLAFLAEAAESDILVDHAALAAAETSDRVEATLAADKRPLGATLDELLRPLGLTYRVFGDRTLQVTTPEAAAERLELEFYPVGRWLTDGTSGNMLAERLKARVAASTWSDVGGQAEIYFDLPSQCLIVLQSQPVQRAIERLLN